MDRDEEFRRNAAEAQRCADKAKRDEDRAAWLRVAQGWLSLLPGRRLTAQERFDDEVTRRGTHQEDSKERH
jgi:hypothetical protein